MPDSPRVRSAPAELLRTKLAPPRLPSALVGRPWLVERLEAGLARKLTLVVAPAGSGKSTLVAAWLAERAKRSAGGALPGPPAGPPAGWVSLEAGDNDPVRFWNYFLTVCRGFQPSLGKAALAALRAAQPPALDALLTPFLNELARLPGPHVLVLEDYHAITAPAIHESLAFVLDHLPPTLHLVLISRDQPSLPLARWRARDELSELTGADLRFSPEETRAFFEQTLGQAPAPETLAQLQYALEGWAAGLRLVALGLQSRPDPRAAQAFMAGLSGGYRLVGDYLVSEVLAAQPESVQQFLLQTSSLARLNASLCDAVTGRTDSARVLDQLARANLFIAPLEGQWYRYHVLFAEVMRQTASQRLGEESVLGAQARASGWYEAHGLGEEAVEAALAARDFERAAALAERSIALRGRSEVETLRRWAAQLPPAVLYAHPNLCFGYAFVLLFTSDRRSPATPALLEAPLQAAEDAWRREGNAAGLGQILSLRAMVAWWQDDLARTFALSGQALELLAEDDVFWRGISLSFVGLAEMLAGRLSAAQRLLLEARALCEAAQNAYAAQAATLSLSEIAAQQGDLDQAAQYAELVLAQANGREDMLDDQGQAALTLAAVAYERDDLLAAERHAARAAEAGRLLGDETMGVQAELLLAWVDQARGQPATAQQRLQALAARVRRPSLLRDVQTAQARLWLAAGQRAGGDAAGGDLPAAERWAAGLEAQPDPGFAAQQEREALTLARLRLRQGQPAAAQELLEPWRADAHAQGRPRSEIEILILKALASDHDPALIRALALAQPQGFRRIFLDEGQPMAALLQAALPGLARRPLAAYAAGLLRAFSLSAASGSRLARAASPLFEPLSPQEQRVLRLLVAGLSNAAIARELVVSTNTVKTQLKSIYRKLDVANRDEAREAASELKLV
jgi:LuxR family maltose regulon positive regulatory protein